MKLRNMTSIYLVREGEILCLYRVGSRVANHKFVGAAGGHFEKEELNDPCACIQRELKEELGLEISDLCNLRLRYITHRFTDGEIRQNYYFFAELKEDRTLTSTEGTLHWISDDEIPHLEMPISAKHMILHYLNVGQFTNALYGGITEETHTDFVEMRAF